MKTKGESRRVAWIVIIAFTCIASGACNPRDLPVFKKAANAVDEAQTKATEEAVQNDPKLRMVDDICSAIPLPSDAKFIRKGDLDDQEVTIGVYYSSDTPYDVLAVSWNNYFASTNWSRTKKDETDSRKILDFENETYRVNIQYGGMSAPNIFSFGCTLK